MDKRTIQIIVLVITALFALNNAFNWKTLTPMNKILVVLTLVGVCIVGWTISQSY